MRRAMAERTDKSMTGQKRHSKGKSVGENDIKNLDGKGDDSHRKQCPQEKLGNPAGTTAKVGLVSGASDLGLEGNKGNVDQVSSETNKRVAKSREEVLAEREAKKLAKQAMKKKAKEKENIETGNEVKSKEISHGGMSGASDLGLEGNKGNVDQVSSDPSKKVAKSREEVLAEREAKKLAKQAMKKKAKDKENIETGTEVKNKEIPETDCNLKEKVLQKPDDNCVSTVIEVKDQKIEPDDKVKGEVKSKAQLRAERRAKQEAQRARKLEKTKGVSEEKVSLVPDVKTFSKAPVKEVKVSQPSQDKIHKVKLFAHLYRELFDCVDMTPPEDIHPSVIRLGTQYSSKVISGANARCLALLNTLKIVIQDYETPLNQEFSRGLEGEISKCMSFLNKCRPVAVSMVNAVKHLKYQVNQIKGAESKKQITDWIDTYIKEQIEKASEAISLFVLQKITDGDVILTYSCSSLIQRILIKANEANIKFRVIVVDGRPWLYGKEMLRRLVRAGISCTYVLFNGLSFIMPEVTKVLLGAHALLANGYVMSRAGSSQIALLAKTYNVPVLVCCETHKFSEKVQTDSFVHNELGDPDKLISNKGSHSKELSKWRTMQYLTLLNLTYDVTPPDLVSAVVTEIAVLPCTSVPVILRVKPQDLTC